MNKETAEKRGYVTTGHYEFSRSPELEAKLAEIKKEGYKAIIAFYPSSPYSRGHRGGGYGIMTEAKYGKDRTAASLRADIASAPARSANIMKAAIEAAQKEIAELEARVASNQKWLADNGYTATVTVNA